MVVSSGGPLDFALEGKRFFRDSTSERFRTLTRAMVNFIQRTGQQTKQGYPGPDRWRPAQFDANIPSPITVSPTGGIRLGTEVKGRLRLVEFNDPQQLTRTGDGYFRGEFQVQRSHPVTTRASGIY